VDLQGDAVWRLRTSPESYSSFRHEGCSIRTNPKRPDKNGGEIFILLSIRDLRCLRLADTHASDTKQWKSSGTEHYVLTSASDIPPSRTNPQSRWGGFTQRCWDEIYNQWLYSFLHEVLFWLGAIAAGAVYGGLHLIAWHGPFHTHA
jgi:hypothetical protein